MHLRSADPVLWFSVREARQDVKVVVVDRGRDDFDFVVLKFLDQRAQCNAPLFGIQMYGCMLHQTFRSLMKTVVPTRYRRALVVSFDMYAVVTFAEPARVSAQPGSVGVSVAVVPVVPGFVHRTESPGQA